MTTLVVGGTGATGRHLVAQLLDRGESVRAIVRAHDRVPEALRGRSGLTLTEASLLDLSDPALDEHVGGCQAIASCLGHNLSFRGIFGPPRRLVTEATRRLCRAVLRRPPASPLRFVLMNTAGNANRDLDEPVSLAHRALLGLIRLTLPPHADNEEAADYLRTEIGPDHPSIEWVVVRPDSLVDRDPPNPFDVHPSPTRSPLFDPGRTSRINVGAFMAELVTDDATWQAWKGQMPVIYDRER
jgi:nucleoside-diphosphate-sugar epimerase